MAGYYASQCFPSRNLLSFKKDPDGGAWLVAYREEQKRRFDAVLYPDNKKGLPKRDKKPKRISASTRSSASSEREDYVELNGMFLLKQMNVDDPSDLAYISIIGKNLRAGKQDDFVLFDNVISIEAGENKLTLETFKTFPVLRELELQVNGISSLHLFSNDFIYLESLNLSYNNITPADMLALGVLPSLKCLHLTGNSLKQLPFETSRMFQDSRENEYLAESKRRFAMLEILYLDENELEDISVFSSLAGLRKLRLLNLARNNLQCVPHLRLLDSRPAKPFDFSLKDERYDAKPKIEKKKTKYNSGEIILEDGGKHEENSPEFGNREVSDFRIKGLSVQKSENHEIGSPEEPTVTAKGLVEPIKTVEPIDPESRLEESLKPLEQMVSPAEPIDPASGLEESIEPVEQMVPPIELMAPPMEPIDPSNGLDEPMKPIEPTDPANGLEDPLKTIEQMVPPMELMAPPMDLNLDLSTDLNLELDTGQEDTDGNEWSGDNGDDNVDFSLTRKESAVPFQSLEKLDISYNDIADEEALLPLTAWPNLMEVNVWENPVTKNCKGPPPLLHYHLTKLCGIRLNRKETKKITKPAVAPTIAPVVRYHKVNDVMPTMRKKNMLMLEFESYEAALQNGSLYGQPLPPIKTDSEKPSTKGTRDSYSAPSRHAATNLSSMIERERPHSVAADQFFERDETSKPLPERADNASKEDTGDGVFLTQIDAPDENMDETDPQKVPPNDTTVPEPVPEKKDENELFKNLAITESRYKGYEELLQIEGPTDDLEIPAEDDIRGNVKALKHALHHPLVFSDPNDKESNRETYTRHDKTRPTESVHKTKGDKVNTALEKMRKQTNVIEENLGVVLERYETDPEIRRQFPDVKKLLKVVQSKYDKVRIASLEAAANAQKILKASDKTPTKLMKKTKRDSIPNEFSTHKKTAPGNTSSKKVFEEASEVSEKMAKFNDLVDKRI